MVDPGIAVERGDCAERDGDQDGYDAGHERDLEGDGHAQHDLLDDRLAGPQRPAEAEARQAKHVFGELTDRIPEHEAYTTPGPSAGTAGWVPAAPSIHRLDVAATDRARRSTSPARDSGWASCTSL